MSQLRGLEQHAKDPAFQQAWRDVKQKKKQQLAKKIKAMTGDDVDTTAMFDVHVRLAPLCRVPCSLTSKMPFLKMDITLGLLNTWTKLTRLVSEH
jgi:hypothetical protein